MLLRLYTIFTCCTLLGCSAHLEREVRTLSVPHVASKPITIESANGSVSLNKIPGDKVQVEATVRAYSPDRLQATKIIIKRDPVGALALKVEWPNNRRVNSEGCDFNVGIPDTDGIKIVTSNGSIQLSNLSGKAELDTSNSRITIGSHTGDVEATTMNGGINSEMVVGIQNLTTSNSSIKVKNATSSVRIATTNGPVDLEFADEAKGPFEIKTSNSRVKVKTGASFEGIVSMKTSNASIKNETSATIIDQGKRRLQLQFGEATTPSKIVTSNGSITIQ